MFRPNQIGTLKVVLSRDVHGRPIFSEPKACPFAAISLTVQSIKTSVRADSSASRGAADQTSTKSASILVAKTVQISNGDHFGFRGLNYLITSKHERFTVGGALDHFQCEMKLAPT